MSCFKCNQTGHFASACPNAGTGGGGGGGGGGSSVIKDFKGTGYQGNPAFDYNEAEKMLFPIASLTEIHTKWTIKARVVDRSDVRKWSNARGDGTLFSCTLVDEAGTAIRATFFKDAVDQFYDIVVPGNVLYFGNAKVKAASKKFSSLPHNYELTFDSTNIVQPTQQHDMANTQLPTAAQACYIPLGDIADHAVGNSIDVIAVIRDPGVVTTVQKKAGGELEKRSVRIVDNSTNAAFEMTLWGEAAKEFQAMEGNVISAKNCRIGKFMDAINLVASNGVELEPHTEEAQHLKSWWHACDKSAFENVQAGQRKQVTRWGLDQIELRNLGKNRENADILYMRGYITGVSDKNVYYIACPKPRDPTAPVTADGRNTCNKKVEENHAGFRCNLHGETDSPNYRYIASMKVTDATGHMYVTAFDNSACKMFDKSAQVYHEMKMQKGEEDALRTIKEKVEWKPCTMTLRVKEEQSKDDGMFRMKAACLYSQVLSSPSDFLNDASQLRREIERYHQEKSA